MSTEAVDLQVEHNEAARQFEVKMGESIALLQYLLHDHEIVFVHTGVPPQFEGKGIGGRLAKAGLEYAKAKGLAVVPRCPFIAKYIEKHPEYAGLVKGAR